jgi:hypothetical protein
MATDRPFKYVEYEEQGAKPQPDLEQAAEYATLDAQAKLLTLNLKTHHGRVAARALAWSLMAEGMEEFGKLLLAEVGREG